MNARPLCFLLACLLLSACVTGRQASPSSTKTEDRAVEPAREVASSRERPDPGRLSIEEQVDLLFQDFGVAALIRENLGGILDLYEVMLQVLPPEAEAAKAPAAERIPFLMQSDDLLAPAEEHFVEHGDRERLASVLLWLGSDVGRSWHEASQTTLQQGEADPEEVQAWMNEFYAALEDDPALQERLELVRLIEETSGQGRRSLELVLSLADLLLNELSTSLPEPMRPREEHVRLLRQSMRATMSEPALQQALFDGQLYATRELDLEELRTVSSYHLDGPGVWYLEVLEGANRKAGQAFAKSLAHNLSVAWTDISKTAPADPESSPES